ncbi:HAD-like protein [Thozetella sp. PMI_491]|nr:HAD-like protein [Thozetella sp. PMI_491]
MASVTRKRQFAPLKKGIAAGSAAPKLQGIIFDVDGTLCEPQTYMFGQMRNALGISKGVDILEHIYALPTAEQQQQAMESVREIERSAMASQVAQPGLTQLMAYLDGCGVRKGILTRNFDMPVNHLLTKYLPDTVFAPIITREFRPPKPDPAGIFHIAKSWGLIHSSGGEAVADASALIMVGDSIDDMTAGRRAGAATVLLVNDVNRHLADHEHTDLVIQRLDDLIGILEHGFLGRDGIGG